MKNSAIILVTLLISLCSFSQSTPSLADFEKEIQAAGLTFEMPEGYSITEVKENPDLQYSFAIQNAEHTIEVRYSIFPLDEMMKKYEASLKDSTVTMAHPNKLFKGIVRANALNMNGGQPYDIAAFPAVAVKEEFNADNGGSCFFDVNCAFGEGYAYGQFIYLHRDNVADVIITYLSNDKTTHSDLMLESFHALRFEK